MKKIIVGILVVTSIIPVAAFATEYVEQHVVIFQFSPGLEITARMYPNSPDGSEFIWFSDAADTISIRKKTVQSYTDSMSYISHNDYGFWVLKGRYEEKQFFALVYTYNAGHDTIIEQHYALYKLFWWVLVIISAGLILRYYVRTYQAQ